MTDEKADKEEYCCPACATYGTYHVACLDTPDCGRKRTEVGYWRKCPDTGYRCRECPCKYCRQWRTKWDKKQDKLRKLPQRKPSCQWEYALKDMIGYDQHRVPPNIYDMIDSNHLDNRKRVELTRFLYGNGISIEVIRNYYYERDRQLGGTYLRSTARRELETIFNNIENGSLRGSYQCIISGKGGSWAQRKFAKGAPILPRSIAKGHKPSSVSSYHGEKIEKATWKAVVDYMKGNDDERTLSKMRKPSHHAWRCSESGVTWALTKKQLEEGVETNRKFEEKKRKRRRGLPPAVPSTCK